MEEELLEELSKLKGKRKKISSKLKKVDELIREVNVKLEELCEHDWKHEYSNDHDGWSRVTYTETQTSTCQKCGKVEVRKRDYDY